MGKPDTTRLRFVRSKDPGMLTKFCDKLGVRIQIYDIEFAQKKWHLWFVPSDEGNDIPSGDLDG